MISYCKKEDLEECVSLHVNTLREGLFYELGENILKKAYYTAITDPDSFLIANKEHGRINGIALGTKNIDQFIEKVRSKCFFDILKGVIKLVIKKPISIITVIDSVFYTGKYKAELLFLFVQEKEGRRGIGTRLIERTNEIFKKWKVKSYRVVFLDSNEKAKGFYHKKGFVLSNKHAFLNIRKLVYVKTLT